MKLASCRRNGPTCFRMFYPSHQTIIAKGHANVHIWFKYLFMLAMLLEVVYYDDHGVVMKPKFVWLATCFSSRLLLPPGNIPDLKLLKAKEKIYTREAEKIKIRVCEMVSLVYDGSVCAFVFIHAW